LDRTVARGTFDRLTEHIFGRFERLLTVRAVELEIAHRLSSSSFLSLTFEITGPLGRVRAPQWVPWISLFEILNSSDFGNFGAAAL